MNFEWFFSKKTIWKNYSQSKIFYRIVIITQITIVISVIITILTFSIGFGFKEVIIKKLLNIKGQIIITSKKEVPFSKKEVPVEFFIHNNSIRHIHTFSEKNVMIIAKNKNVERFVFKGLSKKDYNPVFFQDFLVKGSFSRIKKSLFSSQEVILSQKVSISLGLNIGSLIQINFLSFKKGIPFFISKKFYVCGLYDTGIPEFDDVYIIGDMKHIQNINNWNENFVEGVEFFLSSIDHKKTEFIKNKISKKITRNFMVQTIYDKFYSNILEWIHIFNVNILVIIFVVLIALIINMIVFLLILILERTKTIGILKIIGSENKVIYKIFLYYVMHILIPSLIIGNSIGISFVISQKKFRFLSLNKIQYYIDFVPIYFNINNIVLINLSIIFICLSTMFFTIFFIMNKITLIKVIKFE